MPLSHRRLANWYVQLAQQLDAGIPLAESFRMTRGTASGAVVDTMAATIEHGGSTDDALRAGAKLFPLQDQLALSAAADAGRMPHTLRALATRHSQVAAAQVRIVLACLYPLAVLHIGLFLLPVVRMIDWQTGFHWSPASYLHGLATTMIPLWAFIGLLIVLARRHSPILTRVARLLPALRGYVIFQSLADLTFALGNFVEAGVPIGEAWAAAGLISHAPELKRAAAAMAAVVERGQPPGTQLASWSCFPPEFVAQYRTGETTGQLDTALARLSAQYQDSASHALTAATILYPIVVFLLVAGGVVYFVVSLYAGYLNMITKLS